MEDQLISFETAKLAKEKKFRNLTLTKRSEVHRFDADAKVWFHCNKKLTDKQIKDIAKILMQE